MTAGINPSANDISHYLVAMEQHQNLKEIRYDRMTQAIEGGNILEIEELIEDNDQEFVLCEAIRLGKFQFLQNLLINTYINIFFEAKLSAINNSILNDKSEALGILLQYTNISDKSRKDAIEDAVELGHFACAKVLGWDV